MANNNVLFKRGLQAELANVTTVDNGAFYLTTDTHKLYYGYNDKLNLLDSVIVVENLPSTSDKIEVGYFYYATATNVLAIYDGTSWTQVNPDSKLVITGFTTGVKLDSNTATVTHTLTGKDEKGADVLNIAPTFSIKGEDGITVAIDGTTITLKGTVPEYTLSTPASADGAAIKLNLNGTEDTSVAITGAGAAKVSATENAIVVGAKDTEVTGVEFAAGEAGIDLTITNKVTGADGAETENTITDNFDITVGYGVEEEAKKTATIKNGKIDLNVYTQAEIDEKLSGFVASFNSMEFKGAVAAETELPADAETGWTYKASADFTLEGAQVKVGDLIIATETDWVIIPSGDETVLTYELSLDTNGKIALKENGTEKSAVSIVDAEGNPVQVEIDTDAKTIKVVHAAITVAKTEGDAITQATGTNQEVVIVAEITDDGYGHITGIKTQKITVTDTVVTGITNEVSAADAGVRIATNVAQSAGEAIAAAEYSIESSSLAIEEGSDNQVLINMVWGSF